MVVCSGVRCQLLIMKIKLDLFMGSSSGYLVCSEVKGWRAKFAVTVASFYAQYLLQLLLGTLQRWSFISLHSLKMDHFYYILDIFRSLLLLSVSQILKILKKQFIGCF